jgi:hypothetical protein
VLDRVASILSFKYDRGHNKLSDKARNGLDEVLLHPGSESLESTASAFELNVTASERAASPSINMIRERQDHPGGDDKGSVGHDDDSEDDDEAEFAKQLEMGLEGFTADEEHKDSSMEELDVASPPRARTGLGLLEHTGTRGDVITPRGSPYIDRPKSHRETAKSNLGQAKVSLASQIGNSTARSTPVVSPVSQANSPRMAGLDSALTSSSNWKPPAQRTNVAIDYDIDEEESDEDEEEDDDEDDEEEEDDEEDDGDLDDYARQLESSLQG